MTITKCDICHKETKCNNVAIIPYTYLGGEHYEVCDDCKETIIKAIESLKK